MDVTITTTAYGRIKSALVVATQLQEDARERIAVHAGLSDLIAHRVQCGLEITPGLLWAQADHAEAVEDLARAQQTEVKLKGQLLAKGMVA
jgi:hypothetical protein